MTERIVVSNEAYRFLVEHNYESLNNVQRELLIMGAKHLYPIGYSRKTVTLFPIPECTDVHNGEKKEIIVSIGSYQLSWIMSDPSTDYMRKAK